LNISDVTTHAPTNTYEIPRGQADD
jgi:hypothetical protein